MAWSASSFLALSLAAAEVQRFEAVEPCMGTLFRIVAYTDDPKLLREAFARGRELDRILSDYKPDSELNQLCRAQSAQASPELFKVLELSQQIARHSNGAFDVTVGPVVRLWREARKTKQLPSNEALREAKSRTGWRLMHLDRKTRTVRLDMPRMQLDLGAIAKGYAADEMLATLKRLGISRALVAASGDLAIGDPPPAAEGWRVQVGDEVRTLRNVGVSTSGPGEQFAEIGGVRYSHIVDPRTGLGLVGHPAVTVIAPNGMLADGLATAICVLGGKEGRKLSNKWQNLQVSIHPIRKEN